MCMHGSNIVFVEGGGLHHEWGAQGALRPGAKEAALCPGFRELSAEVKVLWMGLKGQEASW